MKLPYNSNFSLGMYSEKPETLIWKNIYMHPYVPCRVIYYNKNLEATQVPIRWVDKIVVYLNNLIQCSFKKKKKEGNLSFCNSMDWPGDYYAKWNKPVRER